MISNLISIVLDSKFDFSKDYQFGFQNSATPLMEGIIDLHHHIFFYLLIILVLVVWLLFKVISNSIVLPSYLSKINRDFIPVQYRIIKGFEKSAKFTHNTPLEVVWTVLPSLVLVLIAIPSFALLYSIDEIINPEITIKVIGHQWYWSYEMTDFNEYAHRADNYVFDSFMIPTDELGKGELRLLEVDRMVVLPVRTHIRIIVTAADVLHSWAIPSLGIKIDAVPGRLNQTSLYVKRKGLYYGQCSEICGVNHGFMPIAIMAIPVDLYNNMYGSKVVFSHK